MHRPVSAILISCLLLVGLACEEEPPPGFEDGSFGAAHRAEIEDDCDKRIMCAERTNMYLREDAFEFCVSENGQHLSDPAMFQFRYKWLLGRARCTMPDVCNYRDCVDSTYVSWGQSQFDKIDYSCRQKLQCQIDTGMLGVSQNDYYESCLVWETMRLDAFENEMKTAFQTQFFQCSSQTSCMFQLCFPL